MSAFNNLIFRHQCPKCKEVSEFRVQFKASSSYEGDGTTDRFHNLEYSVGDTLPWFSDISERNTWPSDYSYVSQMNSGAGPKYVIDDGRGTCPHCQAQITFYIRITNRRIMRIVGCESAEFNDLTIVHDDGRIEESTLDYDFSLAPPAKL